MLGNPHAAEALVANVKVTHKAVVRGIANFLPADIAHVSVQIRLLSRELEDRMWPVQHGPAAVVARLTQVKVAFSAAVCGFRDVATTNVAGAGPEWLGQGGQRVLGVVGVA